MNFPHLKNNNLEFFLNKAEIIEATQQQIRKDFGMFGIDISFENTNTSAYNELLAFLSALVSRLLDNNYDLFMSVLYQIDINEQDLIKAQQDFPHYSSVQIIAHQIIFRELKKIIFRWYYKA